MSTYRTISLTDMTRINSSPEPDLRFSIKGFELDRKSQNCTPKGFDYSLFSPIEEYLPSEGSIVDDKEELELEPLDPSHKDGGVVVYGSNEVLDFDYSTFEAPQKKTNRFSSKEPLLVDELKARLPELFLRNMPLASYFAVEQSFASNLKNCHQSICPDEKYSASKFFRPLAKNVFAKDQDAFILGFQEIQTRFTELEYSCIRLNNAVKDQYNERKAQLKWEIFSNFSSNKNFENGRSMFEALVDFKAIFQKIIHESDMWLEIDENVNELSDLIVDWNEMVEAKEEVEAAEAEANAQKYIDLTSSISYVEFSLRKDSEFIKENCCDFDSIIQEVEMVYEDFLQHYRSARDTSSTFTYEICSFDDHIKEKLRQNSC